MVDKMHRWGDGIFLGIPMKQYQADLWLWEHFFIEHPIKQMIELGTGNGGLSLFFILQSKQYDFDFITFDTKRPLALEKHIGMDLRLEYYFMQGDIFTDSNRYVIDKIQYAEYPMLLYCDNGDKPLEVATFAPYLESGDYCAVHDWGSEFLPKDVPEYLREIFVEESEEQRSLTRWFIKT